MDEVDSPVTPTGPIKSGRSSQRVALSKIYENNEIIQNYIDTY